METGEAGGSRIGGGYKFNRDPTSKENNNLSVVTLLLYEAHVLITDVVSRVRN